MELPSILKRFFLNIKGLFDGSILSLTKNKYDPAAYFPEILAKSLVLIPDE